MLRAGDLRHRLQFQAKVSVVDPEYSGEGTPTWQNIGSPVRARRTNTLRDTAEAVASGTEVAFNQVRFDLRPRAIDASWRAVGVGGDHDGIIYDIRSVGISNDRSEMGIIAVSGVKVS